jgi:hypothetical protein
VGAEVILFGGAEEVTASSNDITHERNPIIAVMTQENALT